MADSTNKIRAVIFDWAGTIVDYGCRAPVEAFREVFRQSGVEVTADEARLPMGQNKRDHLVSIAAIARVQAQWQSVHHAPTSDVDITRMYNAFLPCQQALLKQHTDIVPGAVELISELRKRGLKIGSTTGYTRELMRDYMATFAEHGLTVDNVFCADDVPQGRPAPWLCFRSAEQLGVYPLSHTIVVDDTPVGIAAGNNAGAWTVAVARSGNALGLSLAESKALSPEELKARLTKAYESFAMVKPDFIIDTVADLLPVIEQIERGGVQSAK